MKEFFHSFRFKLLASICAVLLGIMIYAAVSAGIETVPEIVGNAISKPFVNLSNFVSTEINGFLDKWSNYDKYKTDNDIIRQQLSDMYKDIINHNQILEENKRYKELLKIKEDDDSLSFSPPCNVIGKTANSPYGGLILDKGSDDGVELYNPVITSIGVVGRITEIAPSYSKVTTILSPEVKISVISERGKATGILDNQLSYASEGKVLMTDILKDADIEEGDLIITSGQGGTFPEKQLVGTVLEVFENENGLSLNATIQPLENLKGITNAFVITDFKGKGITME